jgi:hypothetical protein
MKVKVGDVVDNFLVPDEADNTLKSLLAPRQSPVIFKRSFSLSLSYKSFLF